MLITMTLLFDFALSMRSMGRMRHQAKHVGSSTTYYFTSAEELTTFRKAEQEVPWRAVMAEEMRAIQENDTWELASLLAGHRVIGLKWVYKVKRNEAGEVMRHKVRLVAKGYM
jgi:hypothetical protein